MDESFYRDLLENLADGIYFVDSERRITFWNRSAEQLTGYTREEVVGRQCYDNILNHVDLEGNQLCKTLCPLARTLQDGKNRSANLFLQHKDGRRRPVSIHISFFLSGEPVRGDCIDRGYRFQA
jgi:PAS domain S-box-containing protein